MIKESPSRILVEDTLKHMAVFEHQSLSVTEESVAGALSLPLEQVHSLMLALEEAGLVHSNAGEPVWSLSQRGREYAHQVLRAHRLYETYLARETGFRETVWHATAEIKEHDLSVDQINALASRLGHPRFDPHGDPIPTRSGALPDAMRGIPLLQAAEGSVCRIVHVEDEPEAVYARLAANGLNAGLVFLLQRNGAEGLEMLVAGRVITISRRDAINIRVEPQDTPEFYHFEQTFRLSDLEIGSRAVIVSLSPSIRGTERRRLLDLGLVPGTIVTATLRGPFSGPTAFSFRGTQIALRREQTEQVFVRPAAADEASGSNHDELAAGAGGRGDRA